MCLCWVKAKANSPNNNLKKFIKIAEEMDT